MKGYLYILAIAAICSALGTYFENVFFQIIFIAWMVYLFFTERLRIHIILLALASLFFFSHHFPSLEIPNEDIINTTSEFAGEIITPVTKTNKKIEFTLREEETNRRILVVLFPKDDRDVVALRHGASCVLSGTLEYPREQRNPGEFNYRQYLLKKGIKHQLLVDSIDDVQCKGQSNFNRIYELRQNIIWYVEQHLDEYSASWVNSLVFGDDSHLDEGTVELFQRWGLSHIIAISGTHVSILIASMYFVLIKFNLLTKEKAQWMIILFLPLYSFLAGGEPSTWRASFMVILFLLYQKWRLEYSITDVLSFIFLIFLLMDPFIIYHVGFQFSFLITFTILLSRKWILRSNSFLHTVLIISFVSQMVIIPLQFNYFTIFQPLSILINVIVVPYFTFLVIPMMYLLFVLTLVATPLAQLLGTVFIQLHDLILSFIRNMDSVFSNPWLISNFSLRISFIYYVLLFQMLWLKYQGKRRKSFYFGIMITLLITFIAVKPYYSSKGTITMLDIGQGDCIIIELPKRKGILMIDAGAKFDFETDEASKSVYKQTIRPFLQSKGIQTIDALILTHEDTDHNGSAPFIIDDFTVKNIIISDFYEETNQERGDWEKNNIDVWRATRGDTFSVGDQLFYIIGPEKDEQSANENSLVIYAKLGGKSWLFTGDISKDQERDVLEHYPELEVDVLKIAHHGSRTSTDEGFINKINPQIALIPVGQNNLYGHPAEEVINLLSNHDINIYRTDINGAIQYQFEGNTGTFSTFTP